MTQQGNHGALYFLGRVRPGATVVTVDEAGDQTTWAVTSVHNYRKTSLPQGIFETSGDRMLTLVTCGERSSARMTVGGPTPTTLW